MKDFIEAQKEILELAESVDACSPQVYRAKKAKDIDELIEIVKDNISWCFNNKMLTTQSLVETFGAELLANHFIFIEGIHEVKSDQNPTVKTLGSSQATVETLGSSQATVETWGSKPIIYEVNGGLLQDQIKKIILIKKSEYQIQIVD